MKRKSKGKKILLSLVSLVLVAAIGAGIWFYSGNQGGEPVKVFPFNYVGMTEYWGDSQESYGFVETDGVQTVFLSTTQTVTEIKVQEGQMVKKGDVLLTFDTTLSDLALERKRLDVEKLKLQLEDAKKRLREINAMKPMVIPKPSETPDEEVDLGELLTLAYKISDNTDFDGSTPEKALICWLNSTSPITEELLDALTRTAGEYQIFNFEKQQAEKNPSSPSPVPEESTAPSEDPTPTTEPSEDPTQPSEDPTQPSEDPTQPSEDPTQPSEDPTQPSEDPTQPSEDPTEPSEDATQPSEDPTEPSEDPTQPSEDPTQPSEDPTQPSEDPTQPSEDPTQPSEDPTEPSEDPTEPSEDPTDPSEDPTEPVEPMAVNSYYVVFKVTEGNQALAARLTWQGIYVVRDPQTGKYSFQFFDAYMVQDHMLEPDQEEEKEPEIDFGSGFTSAQIAEMRKSQEKTIKDLEFNIKMAEANYKIAQTEVSDGNVYAQIDGMVVSLISEDEAQMLQQPLMKVSAGGGFYVEGSVSELERDSMVMGQEVTINDWNTGMTYVGKVESLGDYPSTNGYWNGMGNPTASYYPFRVFVEESADLQSGSYVNIQFSAGTSEHGVYLENPFLRTEGGRSYVWVRGEDGMLEQRYVTTGKSLWGSYTEILDGLSEEDFVAFPYGKNLQSGAETVESDLSALYE